MHRQFIIGVIIIESSKSYLVPSVEKAVQILEFLTSADEACSLRDIFSPLGIAKTTVYSILTTLVHCNLVHKTPEGLYMPSLKLTAMGLMARDFTERVFLLRPQLEKLRDQTGFTVFISAYDNGEQIVQDKVDGFSSVTFNSYSGQRKKLNTSGGGKAIAAFLSPSELKKVLDRGLAKLTDNSIYEEEAFLAHLEEVRQRGYAIDDNEGEIGVCCVGAPIFMYGGQLYGAVSVSALNGQLPLEDITNHAEMVLEVARNISKSLGYNQL